MTAIFAMKDRFEDLFENYAFELALSWALFFFGVRSLLTGLSTAPGSVQALPLWLAVSYCILATIGGLSVILGVWLQRRITWAYGLEMLGLILSASAWGSYILGVSLMPITGKSTLLILALSALVLGCILRVRAIIRKSKANMTALRQAVSDQVG